MTALWCHKFKWELLRFSVVFEILPEVEKNGYSFATPFFFGRDHQYNEPRLRFVNASAKKNPSDCVPINKSLQFEQYLGLSLFASYPCKRWLSHRNYFWCQDNVFLTYWQKKILQHCFPSNKKFFLTARKNSWAKKRIQVLSLYQENIFWHQKVFLSKNF